jgi:hypothetical protein
MPRYFYKCSECQKKEERVIDPPLENTWQQFPCDCGHGFLNCYKVAYSSDKTRIAEPAGFWSMSLGVHPDQVESEKKLHPSWQFNERGDLWIDGYKDQTKKAKTLGFEVK